MKIDSFNSLLVIKRVAKEKGMTMAEIAEKLGISPINLSTSLNRNPTLKRLKEVADVLGVPVRHTFAFISGCSFFPNVLGVSPSTPGNPIGLPNKAEPLSALFEKRTKRSVQKMNAPFCDGIRML